MNSIQLVDKLVFSVTFCNLDMLQELLLSRMRSVCKNLVKKYLWMLSKILTVLVVYMPMSGVTTPEILNFINF